MRKRYLIIVLISFLLCAAVVFVNYEGYKKGKTVVTEENIQQTDYTYTSVPDRSGQTEETATININTASAQELSDFLPGIGKTKAENIVAYRKAIGGYKSVEELIEVKGIGESTLEMIRDYCRVSDD